MVGWWGGEVVDLDLSLLLKTFKIQKCVQTCTNAYKCVRQPTFSEGLLDDETRPARIVL